MAKTPFDADRGQGTITLDPETEVYLEEDKKHPRYDRRIERPITDEFIDSLDPDKGGRQEEPGIVGQA